MSISGSSIFINKEIETVWNAIANDEEFSVWYAPGFYWKIPIFEAGEQAVFILMPSSFNNLKDGESMSMNFTIKEVILNKKFPYYWDSNQMLFTIELTSEFDGTRVKFNQKGFNYSLENLSAYLEGRELPYS
ncbi:SRPBCC family protein [Sporosarcina sp. FA9]|uniref:SRPBCC family protein n=1 Tax=Sporosarcina sp. FA9 TaxID=3413030 RepID=UPI003F65AB90